MKTPSEWVINYAKNSYTSSAGRAVKELMECYNEASKEINGLIIGNSELRVEVYRLKNELEENYIKEDKLADAYEEITRLKEENEKLKGDLKSLDIKFRECDRDRIAYIKSGAKLQSLNAELVEALTKINGYLPDLHNLYWQTQRGSIIHESFVKDWNEIKSLLQKAKDL